MAARASVFVLILLLSEAIAPEWGRWLVVWNVGQGQWVTLIEQNVCWHFDTGGEHAPWAAIRRACRGRLNRVTFSHWDWDHVSFAGKLKSQLPDVCLQFGPSGESSRRKETALDRLPECVGPPGFLSWTNASGRDENARSRVVLLQDALIPGDSTRAQEKFWVSQIKGLSQARLLVLGHHGSRGSTSVNLLKHLPNLREAIASSRFAKYGHPHARVIQDLAHFRVPLLTTEDWNSIFIEW